MYKLEGLRNQFANINSHHKTCDCEICQYIKALEAKLAEREMDDRNPVEAFHQDLASLIQKYLPHNIEFPTEPALDLISWTLQGKSAFDKLPDGFLESLLTPPTQEASNDH